MVASGTYDSLIKVSISAGREKWEVVFEKLYRKVLVDEKRKVWLVNVSQSCLFHLDSFLFNLTLPIDDDLRRVLQAINLQEYTILFTPSLKATI